MNRDGDKNRIFFERWTAVLFGFAVLTIIVLGRMFYLQVIKADYYRHQADENRLSVRPTESARGMIYDSKGMLLADNKQIFRVMMTIEQSLGLEETLKLLTRFVPLTDADYARIRRNARRKKSFQPITLLDSITWEQAAAIQLNAADLPGVFVEDGLARQYMKPASWVHLLGYVAPLDDSDVGKVPEKFLDIPNFRIGKLGIEAFYDNILQGTPGMDRVEVNAAGRVVRQLEGTARKDGENLTLTINALLQDYIVNQFGDESGAAIVMDVTNGDVLAMVSMPIFDPNLFNDGISVKDWNSLLEDENSPLTNKALSGQYSPGSTFKMIVALAALESGVITTSSTVNCPGYIDIGRRRMHCWKHSGHGTMTLRQALAESCDVYFYEVARRVGVDKIAEMASRFGMGYTHTHEFAQERSGLVPTKAWKRGIFGTSWQTGETMNIGIGQGQLLVTPMQLAVMTAMIANNGQSVRPRFVKGIDYKPSPVKPVTNIPVSHWQAIKDGMYQVNNSPKGTAAASGLLGSTGVKISGKTGTTQVRSISAKERQDGIQRPLSRKERNHALYVGYAPHDNPKYGIVVLIEHGDSGGGRAAPMASKIMTKVLQLENYNGVGTDE